MANEELVQFVIKKALVVAAGLIATRRSQKLLIIANDERRLELATSLILNRSLRDLASSEMSEQDYLDLIDDVADLA